MNSRILSLVRVGALAAGLLVAGGVLDCTVPSFQVEAFAAAKGSASDHHEESGSHHASGPWDDDNHDGVANFFDGSDSHHANSWGHPVYLQWLWHLMNLTILIALLVFTARKGIAGALRDRDLAIRHDLQTAAAERDEAQARYAALEQRLAGFEQEVAKMKADAEKVSQAEKELAAKRAEDAAARIQESAERAIRDETHRATKVLRAEAVQLAVELAEKTLTTQVNASDRERLASAFLDSVRAGGAHG